MEPVSFTDLRANLAKHFDRVEQDRQELVVTRQNHESMVILPLAEWEGMRETLYLMSNPANAERLLASIRSFEQGQLEEHELIDPPAAAVVK